MSGMTTPDPAEVARIAAKLTKAQRETMAGPGPCRSWWGDTPGVMRPSNFRTENKLRALGLVLRRGHGSALALTDVGIAVRDHLQREGSAS